MTTFLRLSLECFAISSSVTIVVIKTGSSCPAVHVVVLVIFQNRLTVSWKYVTGKSEFCFLKVYISKKYFGCVLNILKFEMLNFFMNWFDFLKCKIMNWFHFFFVMVRFNIELVLTNLLAIFLFLVSLGNDPQSYNMKTQ